jgi:PTS system cellobiose-specific IIA component
MSIDLEEVVMGIIINAGQSKSLAYEALQAAKKGHYDQAKTLMQQSQEFANLAHLTQTQLIEADEGTGKTPMNLILVHAQDHLMTSMLAKELVAELIELHQKFD